MIRGYYVKIVFVVYNFRNGKLLKFWMFDFLKFGNEVFVGQGNYSLSIVDVDGDGKDEIIFGLMVVDYDGKGMYLIGLGYGDVFYIGDFDLSWLGFEVF